MSSTIQIVTEAEELAKSIQSGGESQLSFADVLGSRMRAARLLSELATILRMQWTGSQKVDLRPVNLMREERAQMQAQEKQPAFPSFEQWYRTNHGGSTFRELARETNMTYGDLTFEAANELSRYIEDRLKATGV